MKRGIKIFSIILMIGAVLSACTAAIAFVYLSRFKESRVSDELLDISDVAEPTRFYCYNFSDRESRTGEKMIVESTSLGNNVKYKFVQFSDVPQNLINAFIAIEDKRFYDHTGVDPYRSSRAALNYVLRGHSSFGGSTITQQLVKNLTGESDISPTRKIKEAFCALNLEDTLDKSEIIELYLNIINLSDGCRGIGAAAEHFYSKTPSELSLSECATIASITNNPSKYNPRMHPENVIKRRNIVLEKMLELGYIDEFECKNAKAEPIRLNLSQSDNEKVNSWYIDMVIDDVISDLCDKFGMSREYASFMLYRGGYKIYTAMDMNVQKIVEEYYNDLSNFPCDEEGSLPQSSMIIIDPATGDILGVAGAVGVKRGNRVQNYATQAKRPSGSAIKPLSVYTPAFEDEIINWSSIVDDSPVFLSQGKPWPKNANGEYAGNVTIKYAVEHSLNTVPVKLLDEIGASRSFDFLVEGLHIKNLDRKVDMGSASLALGQSSKGITLRELTGGYTVFSNGIMSKPRSYFKVTDSNGQIILDNTANQEKVISTETAAIMTKLLECVVENGTARGLISLDERVSVAGKTGTTQGNCDRFFVGYTPNLLASVWFGYEYPRSLDEFGGNFAAIFWDEVMTKIYEETEYRKMASSFSVPHSIYRLTYNSLTGKAPLPEDEPLLLEDGWFKKTDDHILH